MNVNNMEEEVNIGDSGNIEEGNIEDGRRAEGEVYMEDRVDMEEEESKE